MAELRVEQAAGAAVESTTAIPVYKVVMVPESEGILRYGAVCQFQIYRPGEWAKPEVGGLTCFQYLKDAKNFLCRPISKERYEIWTASARGPLMEPPDYRLISPRRQERVLAFWQHPGSQKDWRWRETEYGWPPGTWMFPEIRLDEKVADV